MEVKVEVVSGATCSDSDCDQFAADAHKCEVCPKPSHAATWTVTVDETMVVFACSNGLHSYMIDLAEFGDVANVEELYS